MIPKAFFSLLSFCGLFNEIFWGEMALGRKYQLLKDKGTITIRIKSPLKEEFRKGFLDIFYYALFS